MKDRTTMRLALGCSLVAFGVVPLAAARFSAVGAIPAAGGGESSRGLRTRRPPHDGWTGWRCSPVGAVRSWRPTPAPTLNDCVLDSPLV
jgi:hypothetical protein